MSGVRVWVDEVDITRYLRTGREPLAVVGGQVVFAEDGRRWTVGHPPHLALVPRDEPIGVHGSDGSLAYADDPMPVNVKPLAPREEA